MGIFTVMERRNSHIISAEESEQKREFGRTSIAERIQMNTNLTEILLGNAV